MKKTLLTILLTTSIFGLKAQDQLSNSGFNAWTTNTIAQRPGTWLCSYDQYSNPNTTPQVVEKSTDATNLLSSVKLNSVAGNNGVDFGFVLLGGLGNGGPNGGVPFTLSADSIVFDAKFNIQAGDSANIYVLLKNSGSIIDMNIFRLGGTQASWNRFALKINPFNLTPDSLILGFTSSETQNNGAAVGSWFMLDNIRFANGTSLSSPIPNPSFETWTDIVSEDLNGWFTFADMFAASNFTTAIKSTDAQEGAYALKLQPDSLAMGGGSPSYIPGLAVYGNFDLNTGNITGKPFVASPTSFTGYYKWAPVNGDTASIQISFQNAGTSLYAVDSIFTVAKSTYTQFTLPITLATAPDTIIVTISGGNIGGSQLLIDNLQFSGGNVGVKQIVLSEATVNIFPNPTVGDANLKIALPKAANVSYSVLNTLGQQVEEDNLGLMKDGVHTIKLNTSNYTNGVYFVKVKIGDNMLTQKVIVK
ncbi:MAG: T9SS type A sorting domain-containing protein [Flavobacteriia bacterium]|nr:T9SS type A sorting domain-containing protein [Flavobacteriia bacterium]